MKILVVDDHQYNRDLLSFILHDEGYDCVEACDGLQAFNMLVDDTGGDIDIILMDINMPVMDGVTATQKIKEAFPDKFLPILFVTALDDSDVVTKCLGVGGDDFIPKPINEEVLIAKIKAHARSQSTYNTLKVVNEKLNYHQKLVEREHSIVDHVFNNRDKRIKTSCDNVVAYTSPMSMFDGDSAGHTRLGKQIKSFPEIAMAAFGPTGNILLSLCLYFELFSCLTRCALFKI